MGEKQIFNVRYRDLVAQLKAARKTAGMTQAEAARRVGLNRTWIAKVECCELRLDLLHFAKLCRVYGLKASELIGRMDE